MADFRRTDLERALVVLCCTLSGRDLEADVIAHPLLVLFSQLNLPLLIDLIFVRALLTDWDAVCLCLLRLCGVKVIVDTVFHPIEQGAELTRGTEGGKVKRRRKGGVVLHLPDLRGFHYHRQGIQ
jgi:hypothetical protein